MISLSLTIRLSSSMTAGETHTIHEQFEIEGEYFLCGLESRCGNLSCWHIVKLHLHGNQILQIRMDIQKCTNQGIHDHIGLDDQY